MISGVRFGVQRQKKTEKDRQRQTKRKQDRPRKTLIFQRIRQRRTKTDKTRDGFESHVLRHKYAGISTIPAFLFAFGVHLASVLVFSGIFTRLITPSLFSIRIG